MGRLFCVVTLTMVLSSCGGGEVVGTTRSQESTTTASVTTTAAGPSTTASTPATTPSSASTTEAVGPDLVTTSPEDPALSREAWLGVTFMGSLGPWLPAGFEDFGGTCLGDPHADPPCTHSLHFAAVVDDPEAVLQEWLVVMGRLRGRDEAGIAEWEIVDALYVAYPSGSDLILRTECWANSGASINFGVTRGWSVASVPLRAWYGDWRAEAIREMAITTDLMCSGAYD